MVITPLHPGYREQDNERFARFRDRHRRRLHCDNRPSSDHANEAGMGVMPQLNPIEMIMHMPAPAAAGGLDRALRYWHVPVGRHLWLRDPKLAGPHWLRGAIFAPGAWLILMVGMMPMAGAGPFGMQLGLMASAATLMLHWIYGRCSRHRIRRLDRPRARHPRRGAPAPVQRTGLDRCQLRSGTP